MSNLIQLADLIRLIKETVIFFRIQDFYKGQNGLSSIICDISKLRSSYISDVSDILNNILSAQKNKDNILIADLLEGRLLYYVENALQELVISEEVKGSFLERNLSCLKDVKISEIIRNNVLNAVNSPKYSVEMTNMGVYTVKVKEENSCFYYHSNLDPFNEGELLAKYYINDKCFNYNVLGFGLGYHVRALLNMDRRYNITVIESNPDILTLAFLYCDLEDILTNSRFKLLYGDIGEVMSTLEKSNNEEEKILIIHYPSLRVIKDMSIKKVLEDYFINVSSMLGQKKYIDWNFYYNIRLKDEPVDTVFNTLFGKSVVYVGGGPSLEDNINYLKKIRAEKEKIILCASTVYKKLLSYGIIPDYVVIIDAKDNMINHIRGTLETSACMLYLCTAYTMAVQEFKGRRYIIFQKGYSEAEKYAAENNYTLIETGGSVSTTAIDIILRSGCKELIMLGMDLAYTDNKRHSFDSGSLDDDVTNNLIMVKAVGEGMVPTTNILNIYKQWIERRIENISDVSLINVSRGAYIKGMKNLEKI